MCIFNKITSRPLTVRHNEDNINLTLNHLKIIYLQKHKRTVDQFMFVINVIFWWKQKHLEFISNDLKFDDSQKLVVGLVILIKCYHYTHILYYTNISPIESTGFLHFPANDWMKKITWWPARDIGETFLEVCVHI